MRGARIVLGVSLLLLALLVVALAGCVGGDPVGPGGCWTEHRFVWVPGAPVARDSVVVVCDRR